MSRQLLGIGVVAMALLLGLSACGGSDGEKADPKPTRATTTAAPVQPKGADGVTYHIVNWEAYADDPAVLAYKRANEAINASANKRKVLPAMRGALSKPLLRQYTGAIQTAWKRKWHTLDRASARVESARTTSSRAKLTMCEWKPSLAFYDKKNKIVGTGDRWWDRVAVTMTSVSGRWVVSVVKFSGKCPGGAPA